MVRFAALMVFATFALHAHAAEVYRCETASGVVRYSDKPCSDGRNERLDIESRPTDNSTLKEQTEQRKAGIAELDNEKAKAEQAAAEAAKAAEQRKTQCAAARKRLEAVMQARRITRGEGEDIEYLDSAEILEQRQQAQDRVNEFCGT